MVDDTTNYRYAEMDQRRFRYSMSGQVRFRLLKKLSKNEPYLVLQLEEQCEIEKHRAGQRWWAPTDGTNWRDATLQDLSVMDISKLTIMREGGEMPVCFRPMRHWGSWALVLQIMNGSHLTPCWSDAKMSDLLFKEGKILGGIGLVSR